MVVDETSEEEIYGNWILFGSSVFRQIRRVQKKSLPAFTVVVFVCVFFKCLLLKIINILKQHILGVAYSPFQPPNEKPKTHIWGIPQ